MNEREILDAPESQNQSLKIPFRLIVVLTLSFTLAFWFLLFFTYQYNFFSRPFRWSIFTLYSHTLTYPMIISFGLYFFNAAIQADNRWLFRVISTAVSIIFVSCLIAFVTFLWMMQLQVEIPGYIYANYFHLFRQSVYIALAGGIGGSLAVRFLLKKNYLVFSAIMFSTFVVFSLIDNL